MTEARRPQFAIKLLPSLADFAFLVPIAFLFGRMDGVKTLLSDCDTGWHIRNGETIVAAASVPTTDPFSYTREGQPWFAWEWLSDAILGTAHHTSGLAGVAFLAAITIALTAWGATRLSLHLGGNLFFTAVGIVLMLGTTSIHWLARPHIFSWLLALAFVAIAEQERQGTRHAWWFLLPLLACVLLETPMHTPRTKGSSMTLSMEQLLRETTESRASDLHLSAGEPPSAA